MKDCFEGKSADPVSVDLLAGPGSSVSVEQVSMSQLRLAYETVPMAVLDYPRVTLTASQFVDYRVMNTFPGMGVVIGLSNSLERMLPSAASMTYSAFLRPYG